ncbi:MAG: type IX secretion system sortase PorU [Paludibacteraceae bacterium]|nr:type IX secretion system sortase PorU [Paludibacteraceae bacterium]
MKRLVTILGSLFLSIAIVGIQAGPHVSHSRLSQGKWVKIQVNESGVYCLTYDQLRQAGLDPAKTHVYGYGGAMLPTQWADGVIDDLPQVGCVRLSDRILFYGQGSFRWKYEPLQEIFTHTRNPYSDRGYYFLSDVDTPQPDLVYAPAISSEGAEIVDYYTAYQVHEQDILNLLDPTGVDGGGREFYGETLSPNTPLTIRLPFSRIVSDDIHCRVMIAGVAKSFSQTEVKMGSETKKIATAPCSDHYTFGTPATLSTSFTAVGKGDQSVSITFLNTESGSKGYLNYVEMSATCSLTMDGAWLAFRTPARLYESTTLAYHISNANSQTLVLDITHLDDIKAVQTSIEGNTLVFYANNEDEVHEYVAIQPNASGWQTPSVIGSIENQDLHGLRDIMYVVISPKEMVGAAEQLCRAHVNNPYRSSEEPFTWAVVTDQQVYNEFSSGTPDATAYRKLMKMLYENEKSSVSTIAPRWLLLMGDGTYDNRKLLTNSGPNTLLTYQAIDSENEIRAISNDGYFGYLKDSMMAEAKATMEIGVGRLPVSTVDEAQAMVNKIEEYICSSQQESWRRELLFMADNVDDNPHIKDADAVAAPLAKQVPDYVIHKIYLDAYPKVITSSSESCPIAQNQLDNYLQNGILMLNYSGHGGYNAVTSESMITLNSIRKMTNSQWPLWFFATCSFAHFDSGKKCAAEEAVLNPHGGAIGVISSCRTVYANMNRLLNNAFCSALFEHQDAYQYPMTIGEALMVGKNKLGYDTNKLAFFLLGDPAIRLPYPSDISVQTTTQLDTLSALNVYKVHGFIQDAQKDTATWFNGTVDVTVYDKQQQMTVSLKNQEKFTYNDYPNVIFHGRVEVVNGFFSYQFMTPKDIRYNYGPGRIVYYAFDNEHYRDGLGIKDDFVVGGISSITITDSVGPDIVMYLEEEEQYKPLDATTYSTPRFYATLYDKYGINTVGSSIGHDLELVVDNSATQTYNLNSLFMSDRGTYQSGSVTFRLPALEDGPHSLFFRAWNLVNLSSTRMMNFTVKKDAAPTLYKVIAYPNPASLSDELTLELKHDQKDQILATEVSFYDLAGRRLWSQSQPNAFEIHVPMSQIAISTGLYIYRVTIKSETNGSSALTGKILVLP